MGDADTVPISELLDERRHLLDVAAWMLGSRSEATSVVDETYRRWYALPDAVSRRITEPRSWLAKTAGAICLDRLVRPGTADDAGCPAAPGSGPRTSTDPTLEEQVGQVLLNALDSLSPAERATLVFTEAPGMSFGAPAGKAGDTGPRRRGPGYDELADRARSHLRARRSRPTSPGEHDALVHAVLQACRSEDTDLLGPLLHPDVMAVFDGGGKVRAPARPVHGHRHVARNLLKLLAGHPRTTLTAQSVNGRTGLVARHGHQVAAVVSLDTTDGRVAQVWVVLNPDKLHSWNKHPAPAPT
jgi:RNA polymerase sigma-70 factor (ECF subfamily)